MLINTIKGIIFDYGGTIDSNGKHWAEVLWEAYRDNQVPVEKQAFRDAYVYGERFLAKNPVIKPQHTFQDLLLIKTELQLKWLIESGFLPQNCEIMAYSHEISKQCYNFAHSAIQVAIPIIENLSRTYPLVLVSNFYGNVEAVLSDFGLTPFFNKIIESAVVGVRKPDPAIFALGVKALKMSAEEVVVIGDSHDKDIVPASRLGCKTIWIQGQGWEDSAPGLTADVVIDDFKELNAIFQLN